MAYFANGSEGDCFAEQCSRCRYGDKPCPVAMVQFNYNYAACNNEVASSILHDLVKQDGTCAMYELDPDWFERRQGELDLEPSHG